MAKEQLVRLKRTKNRRKPQYSYQLKRTFSVEIRRAPLIPKKMNGKANPSCHILTTSLNPNLLFAEPCCFFWALSFLLGVLLRHRNVFFEHFKIPLIPISVCPGKLPISRSEISHCSPRLLKPPGTKLICGSFSMHFNHSQSYCTLNTSIPTRDMIPKSSSIPLGKSNWHKKKCSV